MQADKNYSVKIYWNDGSLFKDLYINSNASGYLSFSTTGFKVPRYTVIRPMVSETSHPDMANTAAEIFEAYNKLLATNKIIVIMVAMVIIGVYCLHLAKVV